MNSIVNPGIFTSQGLLSFVFIAFGCFLFYKARANRNDYAKADKRLCVFGVVNIIIGIVFFIIYIRHLKDAGAIVSLLGEWKV